MRHRGALVAVSAGVITVLALGSTAAFAVKSTAVSSKSSTSTTAPKAMPPGARPRGDGPGRHGGGGPGGMVGAGLVEVVAKLTGESTGTVLAARQSGTSFATFAQTKGVTASEIVELALHAPKAALDSEVSDGLVTKAQAAAILTETKSRLTAEVNETGTGRGDRGAPNGRPGTPPPSASASGTATQ